jgi:tetratricopeptide (TPR) repeat protein
MAGIRTFAIQVSLALLVCALLLGGCDSEKTKEVEMTAAEKEKARLLGRIDRKFENPDAHFELGRLYQADGLWSQAEHQYNITLNFDPTHREAQAARVKVLLNSGDTDRAELLADEYMGQASVSAAGSLRLALAFQRQALDEYALACYRQALRLAPNSAKINRQIGYYYLSKNDKARAQDYLTRSFQLNPNQPEVAGELGRLGTAVKIPRKTKKSTKKLDKIVEESDREYQTQ